ncbi:MAG: ABC transporter permease subunit [Paralcaligenes sp.]
MPYQFDLSFLSRNDIFFLMKGMAVSLEITLAAFFAGILWGTFLALMRMSKIGVLRFFATWYINLFRSVPLIMVLLWFFLIVPQLLQSALNVSPTIDMRFVSALVAYSLFEAAYYAEIIRSGVSSVSSGQLFAAKALGMTNWSAMRLIVLPQAFRNMMPIILTQGIILFQDTALVYVIALADFFGEAYGIGVRNGRIVEMILLAGFVYLVICSSASIFVNVYFRKKGGGGRNKRMKNEY